MLAPLAGSFIFIVLYIIAATLYPGGSQEDERSNGFSWQHNYWCNLLSLIAINGEYNQGRPVAIAAMITLVIALLGFWMIAARLLPFSKYARNVIQFSGLLSIAFLPFLSTSLHDIVINSSGFFGLVAMIGIYIGIYRKRWYRLFLVGLLNLLLIGINNYLYYSDASLYFLPLVQKITFLSIIIWICFVDVKLYLRL